MKLGTRQSRLALTQSGWVARQVGPDVELVGMVTEGDRLVDVPLRGQLAKGFFTEELESGLLEGRIDLAVHSLKDLPVADREGLAIGAVPPRESVCDVLVVRAEAWDPDAPVLPLVRGARVGATSTRRQALLRTLRPDLEPQMLRGNVPTRVTRLAEGRYDAIVLAEAGLNRLRDGGEDLLKGWNVARLHARHWPPAPGQGALAVQCRADDTRVLSRLAPLHHPETAAAAARERLWLSAMGGGCSVPFGAVVSGEDWALGLERDGVFHIRRGRGLEAGDAALAAVLAGEGGEGWNERVWEEVDVGA